MARRLAKAQQARRALERGWRYTKLYRHARQGRRRWHQGKINLDVLLGSRQQWRVSLLHLTRATQERSERPTKGQRTLEGELPLQNISTRRFCRREAPLGGPADT